MSTLGPSNGIPAIHRRNHGTCNPRKDASQGKSQGPVGLRPAFAIAGVDGMRWPRHTA